MAWKHIPVQVRFLDDREGGRSRGVGDHYRGQLRFDGVDTEFGFELGLPEPVLELGVTTNATLGVWAGDVLPPILVGQHFDLREGTKVVARGTVISHEMPDH